VDVASGVERAPGVKDQSLLLEFIRNAKACC
jgi:phosphoribosylanthranilate isomerase